MTAEDICQEIIVETDHFYRTRVVPALEAVAHEQDDPSLGPAGYTVLFGPPLIDAKAFFVGFQPGGGPEHGEDEQPAERKPMWPDPTSYAVQDWKLARVMQSIFGVDFLRQCTGANRQFFRAASDVVYAKWPLDLRVQTQEFSASRLARILDVLLPKKVVFIGKRAFFSLVPDATTIAQDAKDRFLVGHGSYRGFSSIGCIHLTGARIATEDRVSIEQHLRQFVDL